MPVFKPVQVWFTTSELGCNIFFHCAVTYQAGEIVPNQDQHLQWTSTAVVNLTISWHFSPCPWHLLPATSPTKSPKVAYFGSVAKKTPWMHFFVDKPHGFWKRQFTSALEHQMQHCLLSCNSCRIQFSTACANVIIVICHLYSWTWMPKVWGQCWPGVEVCRSSVWQHLLPIRSEMTLYCHQYKVQKHQA